VLGKKLEKADGEPVEGGTDPSPVTSPDVAKTQRQLKVCQWLIPGLTGAIEVLNALHGEQQRPNQQVPGIVGKPAQIGQALAKGGRVLAPAASAVAALGARRRTESDEQPEPAEQA
jgi:hypothetical protein